MHKVATVAFFLLFFFATTGGCDVRPTVREIANSIEITPEWTELHPTPPLVASEQIQSISIVVPDTPDWNLHPETSSFTMPNGETLKIEVELIAVDGKKFSLDSIGLGAGLLFSRRPSAGAEPNEPRLPKGMTFPTVRFRANQPVHGGKVSWICMTNY
ncbi:MAG: hypothetical protein H6970_00525 [Gammaproteobacteria bacterium]|nr:hypothetical protein [Gammaproteobacteria bacterium]MCP5423544.1 hypothetical protein [Gammaproteobacteria bacterium]